MLQIDLPTGVQDVNGGTDQTADYSDHPVDEVRLIFIFYMCNQDE